MKLRLLPVIRWSTMYSRTCRNVAPPHCRAARPACVRGPKKQRVACTSRRVRLPSESTRIRVESSAGRPSSGRISAPRNGASCPRVRVDDCYIVQEPHLSYFFLFFLFYFSILLFLSYIHRLEADAQNHMRAFPYSALKINHVLQLYEEFVVHTTYSASNLLECIYCLS